MHNVMTSHSLLKGLEVGSDSFPWNFFVQSFFLEPWWRETSRVFFSSKSCQAGVQHKKIQKAKNAAARKNSGLIDMLVFFTEPKKLNAACRAVQALLCELRAQPGIMWHLCLSYSWAGIFESTQYKSLKVFRNYLIAELEWSICALNWALVWLASYI